MKLNLALSKALEFSLIGNVLPEKFELLSFQFCDFVSQAFLLQKNVPVMIRIRTIDKRVDKV